MANYDQRMDYGVSSPSSIKENTSINGLADSGFDTFDLSASPTQSHDLDHYPTSVNGHANHSPDLFDPLKPVQENGDPPNLLDMDFFDPLAPLPEEFPSPENNSSPNLMDEQLLDFGERDSSPNGSLTASPVDFFSRTVDPDASLGAGRTSSTASEDGGSISEGHVVPSGSLSKERDSGAECDSIDDEVQLQGSPNLLPSIYQTEVDNDNEHGSEHDQLHDAVVDTGYKNKINAKKGKTKELDPPTVTSHLEIKVKRSKTEVKMRGVSEAEKENINVVQKKVPLAQKEKENIIVTQKQVSVVQKEVSVVQKEKVVAQKEVSVVQKEKVVAQKEVSVVQKEKDKVVTQKQTSVVQKENNDVSPSPVSQDLPENILVSDDDHEQFLNMESNENISDEMKENVGPGVSVNHLKTSFTNGFEHTDEEENIEKEVIITGVDIRTLRENYCQNTQIEDADKYKERIETGVSIKDLRARSVGDLTREESRTSEFPLGVSVEALRASYCDLIKLEEAKVRERHNINTGVSIKFLKTSFISNEAPNNESPGVKIDRAKITRSFSQDTYPLYALLDAYDGVLTRDEQSNLCRICGRPVFLMDRIKAEKSVFHRTCFRCKECNKQLTVDSYCSHETVLYCKLHFKQLFQPKVNFDEEPNHISRRKTEDVIKENIPMELPPDVIRSSDKPDYGLEEIPSLKNIKSRFESAEDELDGDLDKGQVSVKRSESILSKMAKFQAGDAENGHYDDYESDENETTDPDVVKETRKKEKVVFSGMNDLKSQWEKGPEKAWDEERARETQEELNVLRQTQSKGNVRAAYENALQEVERSPAKEAVLSSELKEIKSIAEKWERGDGLSEIEQEKLNHFNKEKEEDLSVFRESGMNEARNLFKKIDETVSKSGTSIVFNKSPSLERNSSKRIIRDQVIPADTEVVRSTIQKEEIVVDSTNLHEKFKFFENYQEPQERKRFTMTPPRDPQPQQDESDTEIERDPNVVRSCDHEEEVVTDTARKMLNKFRVLETQRAEEFIPQGPKPLKRITPPRDYTAVYDDDRENSPEPDRDPNVIRCSDKIEDVALIEAEKTRSLRAKFENWANEDDEEDDYTKSYDYDNGQPSIDTTKNLKAKFEALREETERANTKPKSPKVNRFVDQQFDQCTICSKRLYAMEKMEANNQRFHKSCFKCYHCSSPLRLDNYTISDGTFYCTPHFKQLFIKRGNYDEGFGREQHKEKWNRSRSTTPNRSRSTTPTVMGTGEYGEATQEIYA